MNAERFNSAYRLGIGIALVYVLWLLVINASGYAQLVMRTTRDSRAIAETQRKMTAPQLEAELVRAKQFAGNSGLHCERARGDWDYLCSYKPTPPSDTRLQFGIIVDSKRWLQVSRIVPMGTIVPPPQPQ